MSYLISSFIVATLWTGQAVQPQDEPLEWRIEHKSVQDAIDSLPDQMRRGTVVFGADELDEVGFGHQPLLEREREGP